MSSVLGKKVLKFIRQNAQRFFVRPLEGAKTARDNQARAAKKSPPKGEDFLDKEGNQQNKKEYGVEGWS